MRANEFIREDQKLDEVLPLVGLAAKAAGGMLARGAAKAAGGMLARGAANAVGGAMATGAAKAAGGMLARGAANAVGSMLSKGSAPTPARPSQTMGAPNTSNKGPGSAVRDQAVDQAKDQVIKPGSSINLPTDGTGGPEQFKVTGIQGDEVEIENPNPTPGEPRRVMYKKDDIKQSMSL